MEGTCSRLRIHIHIHVHIHIHIHVHIQIQIHVRVRVCLCFFCCVVPLVVGWGGVGSGGVCRAVPWCGVHGAKVAEQIV